MIDAERLASFADAWAMLSSGPADILGLSDRGRIADGYRADLTVLEHDSLKVVATMAGGVFSHVQGRFAAQVMEA